MKYKRRKKHSNMFQYRNKQQSWHGSPEQQRYVADQLKKMYGYEADPEEVKKLMEGKPYDIDRS